MDIIDSDGAVVDPRELRNAFGRFATGVAVITTRSVAGRLEGLTCNSFSAVSLDPPIVLWSLRKEAGSLTGFLGASHFAVSILSAEQEKLALRFARPGEDKFTGVDVTGGLAGCPLIEGAIASFECERSAKYEAGDHVVFFGLVRRAVYFDGPPLIFNAGHFRALVSNGFNSAR